MKLPILLILCLSTVPFVFAKGGGGGGRSSGGGGGGYRGGGGSVGGSSGGRGEVARGAVSSKSSYSGGVRSGSSGTKIGSSSSSNSFGSSSFRSKAFHSSVYFRRPIFLGRPFVIVSASAPIPYDNRTYHWTAQDTNKTYSASKKDYIICQYDIGKDDGQLQNITFANGTRPTSVFFGCNQDSSFLTCCGMYCCENSTMFYIIGSVFPFGSFNADSFQSILFKSLYFQDANESFVIPRGNPSVYYNDRNYYWSRENFSNSHFSNQEDSIVCEYVIGDDDGELQKVEFANGTKVSSLFFECGSGKSKCCGMYCCLTGYNVSLSSVIIMLFAITSLFGFLGCLITCFFSRVFDDVCCFCPKKRKNRRQKKCEKYCCNDFAREDHDDLTDSFAGSDIECHASSSVDCS